MDKLTAIAQARRQEILRLVWDDERSAGQIAQHFDVSFPAISQHLKVLLEQGLVTVRKEGRSRYYLADKAALGSLRAWLEDQWRTDLSRLKHLAEAQHQTDTTPGGAT